MKTGKKSALLVAALGLLTLCGPVGAVEGMVSYWRFDEASGDVVWDFAGDNDGTVYGATWTDGIVGGALNFDGVEDYVEVLSPSNIPSLNEPWSVGLWVKVNAQSSKSAFIFARGVCYPRIGLHTLILHPGGHLWNSFCFADYDTGTTLGTDTWYHIANTYDGDIARVYVDGLLVWVGNPPTLNVQDTNIYIGSHTGGTYPLPGYWFNGVIDEVRLYDRVLTPDEIAELADPTPLHVAIDIKPGSDPNPINQGSNGLVPVAIFSSADFDATTVVPETVLLGGANVALRGKGKSMAHEEDVNGDGLIDLVVQVEITGFDEIGEDGIAILTGETTEGIPIEGSDVVVIVPPGQ
jgi:hypothetical protein